MKRPDARVVIDPDQNLLIGSAAILRYLKIRSIVTLYRWVEEYGFPAVKRPIDGRWMTSCTAIDSWIFMGSNLDYELRGRSRGTNLKAESALAHALKEHGPDSIQARYARLRLEKKNDRSQSGV